MLLLRETLVVETVAGFVHDAEERGAEIGFVVACREAGVAGAEVGAEGMGDGVDATGLEVESDVGGYLGIQGLLPLDRVVSGEDIGGNGV